MKYFIGIYNSFLWAMVVALTCFKSQWFEMRVNIGYVFFISFIILSCIFINTMKWYKVKTNKMFTIINIVVSFVYSILLYGMDRLKVVPASIVREGIHLNKIPFSTINIVLSTIIILGLAIIIVFDKKIQEN